MEPLLSDLGYLAETGAVEQILDSTYICPPGTDEDRRDFLWILKHPLNIEANDKIDTSFTTADFQAYWKKLKERMSSSLSTLHFSHNKAVIKNDTLSEMHLVFTNIAVNLGFSPKQCHRSLTVMLKKKKGVILVNKLQPVSCMLTIWTCSSLPNTQQKVQNV